MAESKFAKSYPIEGLAVRQLKGKDYVALWADENRNMVFYFPIFNDHFGTIGVKIYFNLTGIIVNFEEFTVVVKKYGTKQTIILDSDAAGYKRYHSIIDGLDDEKMKKLIEYNK